MPRYYFDLIEGEKREIDRAGVVVEDLQSAERAAQESARDCMVTRLLEDKDPDGRRYEIVDAKGNLMSTVCFRDLLPSAVREAENE